MGVMRKSRLGVYKRDRLMEHFLSGTASLTVDGLCGVSCFVMSLGIFISCIFDIVGAFLWRDGVKDAVDGLADTVRVTALGVSAHPRQSNACATSSPSSG